MSSSTLILTIISGFGAIFGLLGCIFAAYADPYKRWLYVITSLLMAYFIWIVVVVIIGSFTNREVSAPLFREAIGSLFFVIGLHGILDGKLRRRNV